MLGSIIKLSVRGRLGSGTFVTVESRYDDDDYFGKFVLQMIG